MVVSRNFASWNRIGEWLRRIDGSDEPCEAPAERAELTRQIEERLRAIPGVERVTASFPFPLAGGFSAIRWGSEEALADNSMY
jgi:hypothetical protein